MFGKIGRLGDRLLARVVPRTAAGAASCWYEYAPISSPCIRRTCCNIGGHVGVQCTSYRPC
ncbi:hypothetical protein ACOQFV_04180 [Nocardiopsis changdeensis]|uniref:Uncharacterized protein n=1 Tax=Nocardiopsis changdeensis TaxID=2831969 RepID=A0ABX8BL22_9ACTN|nr:MULTISPECIES: hypothetical protein [Nocardiopsis]QKW31546.1 hypothetical protein HUT17_00065 [Nocardiopsis flavescens]QUX22796.1 hypothetical protein KGD84_31755 [Nocardiopsis changdeensis]QYX38738.1 hypothetical protein K1J57_09135 [Nocardiopsis sp. MT53]